MHRVVIVFLAVMLILSFRGCDLFKGPEMGSDIKAEMLKYLEDKYDQEFEVEYISFGDWLHPRTAMGAYPAGGDSVADRFVVTRDKDGRRVIIEDGYYEILIRDEYEEYIREVVEKYFPDCKYYTSIMGTTFDSSLTKEVSLEEAMKIQPLPLAMFIFAVGNDESEYTKTFNDFCIEISSFVPDVLVTFIGLEEADFNNLLRKNYEDNIYQYNDNKYSRVNFFLQERWRNGEVQE